MRAVLFLSFFALIPGAFIIGGLWFLVNMDTVTSEYATYEDAVADNLFDRGWLPHFIPASATDIVTSNNLDLNISTGEFRYDPADADTFLANLRPWRADRAPTDAYAAYVAEMEADGYRAWELENADGAREDINIGTIWVFFMNARQGHAVYDSWPNPDLR
jgi:hypothetical protein